MFYDGDIKDKKILLHACCGPCSLGAIAPLLDEGASIELFFYNPSIIDGEFEKRLDALETVAKHYGLNVITPEQEHSHFSAFAAPLANEREGGERCALCMDDRLRVSAEYALLHGFDAYTTTLTVSPHKNSKLIFSLADRIIGGAPFLARDFKKRDGFCGLAISRAKWIYTVKIFAVANIRTHIHRVIRATCGNPPRSCRWVYLPSMACRLLPV